MFCAMQIPVLTSTTHARSRPEKTILRRALQETTFYFRFACSVLFVSILSVAPPRARENLHGKFTLVLKIRRS